MADKLGTWVIVLAVVQPGNSARFDIEAGALPDVTEPEVTTDVAGMTFTYSNGAIEFFPYSAMCSARYEPAGT